MLKIHRGEYVLAKFRLDHAHRKYRQKLEDSVLRANDHEILKLRGNVPVYLLVVLSSASHSFSASHFTYQKHALSSWEETFSAFCLITEKKLSESFQCASPLF